MRFAEGPSSAPEVAPSTVPEVAGHHILGNTPRHYEAYDHNGNREAKGFSDKRSERQRICGLSPKAFWVIIVALVLIVAAAIAGGVGGGLASQAKDTSTSPTRITPITIIQTPTSTTGTQSSTSSTITTSLIPVFSSGCNATDRQSFTPLNIVDANKPYQINNIVLTFTIYCYTNFANTGNNPQIHKLQQVIDLTSLEDCMTACATYNAALNNAVSAGAVGPMLSDMCTGVVFLQESPNRCDLNQGTTNSATDVFFTPGTEIDSAVLQGFGD